ncbi:unnamed protein product [Rotaria sordida]|uniref:Uncharacterized protein n=1 Tax=Rotaria sordida TaxID=392033 RepID=A0A814PPT5_9BILA|nr:unnamed protein product [Rotaria sordida]CAF3721380.1 unnamed protein product [Rotaria sordida]
MTTTTGLVRDKRSQNPRKVFSPTTTSVPLPTNYLIYMEDTVSYSIVGRASIKKIQDKMATLTINKKKLVGEIVVAGSFARCQAELSKLQRASQSVEKDKVASIDHDNILGNYEFNQNDDVVERNEDDGQTDEDLYEESGESDNENFYNQHTNMKRKNQPSNSLNDGSRPAKRCKRTNFDEIYIDSNNQDDSTLCSTTKKASLSTDGCTLKSIEEQMNGFNTNMLKMNHSIRQMASSSNRISSHNFECYRDSNSQQIFPTNVDYNGTNLITIVGKDFGDFARQIMRILYTPDELQTCILPPRRPHLSREPLDPDRFRLLNEAVRVKYRLATHLYDGFFKYHLGPKLSDFLVEERRRDSIKIARNQAKLAVCQAATQQQNN